ncbi:MAG: hypothetical protein JOS17DRAFT_732281 [Linnemannia elongata]|nr:MAG: hypothetical protein JOS17DRAFT_732281 [Linnemannia elongata]
MADEGLPWGAQSSLHWDGEPWPLAITNYLLEVDPVALEQEYYGPFNTMLTYVFPFAEHYAVAPQSYPNRREAADYLIEFMLLVNNRVVGGVEIKRESDIDDDNARQQPTNRCSTGSARCTNR